MTARFGPGVLVTLREQWPDPDERTCLRIVADVRARETEPPGSWWVEHAVMGPVRADGSEGPWLVEESRLELVAERPW